ncbi:IS1634 family transposase ISTvo4 [bioreactor metagenome]|uniref:IS1634 family transposase ISTvo4 n=1 Tax=bioreactor metagenome TaxID=1076179 RepID=A0A645G7Z9_9ZZZZ
MVVIADKGFGSEANFEMLEANKLKYIVPLKRNNGLFIRDKLKTGNKDAFDGYFMFNGRVIWYYSYEVDGKKLLVYLDNDLKNEEEKDYIRRIESNYDDYTREGFLEKQYDFGTIIFRTNLDENAEKLYCLYKSRGEIEQSFDFLKNLLELDVVYLQDKYAVEAWAFINHISLMLAFLIYNLLRSGNQLSTYSISDFIFHLKYIHKVKVNNSWLTSEISGKTIKLLTSLDLHIT